MTIIQKMRLKGFKSFAKHTEFVFPNGFSTVIGSNGSGKSNICDALCFVLGKSSAKGMRAEKSANLIYNGGKNNSPAKEAQVDIFFDNKKKEFPVEEEYLKISRIVRQNGQSIYKINDNVSTRQQMLELLGTARLDPDGYNIMLQGDIVKFTEMRSEERRGIIEDASGISIYEDKKQKSLRELDKVESKLKEAEIILTERKANLRELQKEKDQAIKYKKLEKDLKDNRATLIHMQIQNRQKKKEGIDKKINEQKEKLNKINNNIKKYREDISRIRNNISELNKNLEDKGERESLELRKNIENLKEEIIRKEERINVCKNEIEKITERSKQIKSDSSSTSKKIKSLREEKKSYEDKINGLEKDLEELNKQLKSLRTIPSIRPNPAVEEVIKASDDNVYGTVGDLIDVDNKYALAIETAAGARLKSIVVEDDFIAQKYIKILKNKKLGIATFLPLNKIKPRNPSNDIKELSKKTEGLAIDLIKFDSKFKNIFEYIFSLTLIVNNIEEARKIGIGRARMVTLEGDLMETSGAMIGGYVRKGNLGKSKLSLKSTGKSFESLEKEKMEKERTIMMMRSEVNNIILQLENMYIPETSRSEKILKEYEKEKKEFEEELKNLNLEITKSKNSLKDYEKEEQKTHSSFKNMAKKRDSFSVKIQEIETKIIKEEEKSKQIENVINEHNINKAKLIGELEGLDKEFEEFKDAKIKNNISFDELALKIRENEREIMRIGNVNLRALEIYEGLEKEFNELVEKTDKLKNEKEDVLNAINEIEKQKKDIFMKTFKKINDNFKRIFSQLSTKGSAHIEIEDEEDVFNSGVEIKVKIVGNKFLDIKSLSGGEKTLTALAFIFSIHEYNPAPFYFFDEVDAALDKANSELLSQLIKKYSNNAQYIIISHNDNVITEADQVYGVAMQDGISKVVSLKF